MKVFLKIVVKLQFGRMLKNRRKNQNKSKYPIERSIGKEKLFHCNKLFAKLKQKKAKREVQAIKSTR